MKNLKNLKNIEILSKNAQKSIFGGVPKLDICGILCGEAGGVISNTPGRGDVCQPGTSVCCYCR
ncbi:hypothetical protein IRZ71_06115 [Flavobacterium sp. ANB]|uniref:hypothetical protein n=1 Tax=unclassified Flavobacterium TaxID=196869 RepID=UPI0012B7ABE3|nr:MULTISPECIES: hypothetical protein [unclassified Flavobacterium]MBF4515906.1 hypothetical protein [Flavobacterium sp. ANB]MTD68908.1 hypothetical protein [Flavobacterium sp. LC2016-13]